MKLTRPGSAHKIRIDPLKVVRIEPTGPYSGSRILLTGKGLNYARYVREAPAVVARRAAREGVYFNKQEGGYYGI